MDAMRRIAKHMLFILCIPYISIYISSHKHGVSARIIYIYIYTFIFGRGKTKTIYLSIYQLLNMYRLNLQSVFFSSEIFHVCEFSCIKMLGNILGIYLREYRTWKKKIHESWDFSLSQNLLDQLFCSIPVKIRGIVTDSWKVHTC